MNLSEYTLSDKIKQKIILTILSGQYANGISCLYIPVSKFVGVKIFPLKTERDFSVRKQRLLFSKGLTPAVGKSFTFQLNWPSKNEEEEYPEFFCHPLKLYGFFTQAAKTNFSGIKEALVKLKEIARKKGIIWEDDHKYNIGKIGRKLVIIDTDPVSFKYYTYWNYYNYEEQVANEQKDKVA